MAHTSRSETEPDEDFMYHAWINQREKNSMKLVQNDENNFQQFMIEQLAVARITKIRTKSKSTHNSSIQRREAPDHQIIDLELY